MIDELEILKVVTKRLDSAKIHYMVTGSVAANFYSTPRMTRDIDIIIDIDQKDAVKISSLFASDFYLDQDVIRDAVHNRQMFNIIHTEGIVKVDFIIRKDTEYRRLEFERRQRVIFEGLDIYVTSPEDLVISKLYWAKDSFSEMQLRDVRNLLKTVKHIDIAYIEKWINELGLAHIYQEVIK